MVELPRGAGPLRILPPLPPGHHPNDPLTGSPGYHGHGLRPGSKEDDGGHANQVAQLPYVKLPQPPPFQHHGSSNLQQCTVISTCGRPDAQGWRRRDRFSVEEKLAMGFNKPAQRTMLSGCGFGNRSASLPVLSVARPTLEAEAPQDSACRQQSLSPAPRRSCTVGDPGSPPRPSSADSSSNEPPSSLESPPGGGATSSTSSRLCREGVERLRVKLLERSRSLHEAFAKLSKRNTLSKELPLKELRAALARIADDVDHDEFFAALGFECVDGLSLMALWRALLVATPEALLWELRCGLISHHLWPCGLRRTLLPADVTVSPAIQRFRTHIEAHVMLDVNREDWSELCGCIGLSPFEAKKLFAFFLDQRTGKVGWQRVCEYVQATVAPGVSFMNFTLKLLGRYGSLRAAYTHACMFSTLGMRQADFQALAAQVGVEERPARKLWRLMSRVGHHSVDDDMREEIDSPLASGGHGLDTTLNAAGYDSGVASPSGAAGQMGLSQQEFVQLLLPWAPESTLDKLASSLREKFGSLAKGRQALRQKGLPGECILTPRKFQEALGAVGLGNHCDADVVLAKTRDLRARAGRAPAVAPGAAAEELTLDDLLDGLRTLESLRKGVADETGDVRELVRKQTDPVWQQLHAVQTELELAFRGRGGRCWSAAHDHKRGGGSQGSSAGGDRSSRKLPPTGGGSRRSSTASNGASRSRSVGAVPLANSLSRPAGGSSEPVQRRRIGGNGALR